MPGRDPRREKMLYGLAHTLYDLVFVKAGEWKILLESPLATRMRSRVIVGRAKHQLGYAIPFLACSYNPFAGEDRQVHRDERQPLPPALQHQAAGIDGVMDGFVGPGCNVDLCRARKKLG